MLSRKQVVPVFSISAMLIRAAAYPSSAVKFPCRTQIRSQSHETSSRSSAAPIQISGFSIPPIVARCYLSVVFGPYVYVLILAPE